MRGLGTKPVWGSEAQFCEEKNSDDDCSNDDGDKNRVQFVLIEWREVSAIAN